MSKVLKNKKLAERPALRSLLAFSLCASLAAFGCTTDRNVGNGDPVVTPGLRNSPTSGAATGTESESVPPPMMSSYSGVSDQRVVRPRISREEAALLITEMQPRVKVLGVVAPGPSGRGYVSDLLAYRQQQNASGYSTINSSIYSAPGEGILSGAGEVVGGSTAVIANDGTVVVTNGGSAVTSAATAASMTGATPVTNAGGVVIAPTTAANATPTANAIAAPESFASVRTLSPTAAAVVNPPASISSSSTLASVSSARTGNRVAPTTPVSTNSIATQSTTTQAATAQSISGSAGVANPVRVVTANGRVTVTNATISASSSDRSQ